uniref:uncharacterized protein isoform X1 n=1 Tax=Myxine glutinosa TaxID=7769 RepID=UPI00358F19E1
MQNTGVSLVGGAGDSEYLDLDKCIICQSSKEKNPTSTEHGRKRIREAAAERNDHVAKRLRTLEDEEFVYHMDNLCYKAYTHKKSLENISKASASTSSGSEEVSREASSRRSRSSISPRPGPSNVPDMRELSCVICGYKKHHGVHQKYRISECDRASKFLETTRLSSLHSPHGPPLSLGEQLHRREQPEVLCALHGCSTLPPAVTVMLLVMLTLEGLLFFVFTAIMFGTQMYSICTDETGIEQLKKEQREWVNKSKWLNLKAVFGHECSFTWLNPFSTPEPGKSDLYQYIV